MPLVVSGAVQAPIALASVPVEPDARLQLLVQDRVDELGVPGLGLLADVDRAGVLPAVAVVADLRQPRVLILPLYVGGAENLTPASAPDASASILSWLAGCL